MEKYQKEPDVQPTYQTVCPLKEIIFSFHFHFIDYYLLIFDTLGVDLEEEKTSEHSKRQTGLGCDRVNVNAYVRQTEGPNVWSPRT